MVPAFRPEDEGDSAVESHLSNSAKGGAPGPAAHPSSHSVPSFAWFEKAYADHPNLTTLNVNPAFDPLRDDPRFENLMRRVRFRP